MIPDLIAARSLRAFAIGARQLVVQDAAEMMLSSFCKFFVVYIVNDCRKVISSWSRNNYFLSTCIDVSLSFCFGCVESCTLQNNVNTDLSPKEAQLR